MGVPAEAAAGPRVLPALHQVDEPREGRVQAGRLEGGVAALGPAQEQAGHELRDHGPRPALLLPARDPRQGGRPAPRLPVRGRAQGHRRDRLFVGVESPCTRDRSRRRVFISLLHFSLIVKIRLVFKSSCMTFFQIRL